MAAASATAIHRNQVDLSDFINWSGIECLNQNFSHTFTNALSQGWITYVVSELKTLKVLGKPFSIAYRALSTTLNSLWGAGLAFVYGKNFGLTCRDNDSLLLESDADEQILMYIPFNQVIKLHSLVIKGHEEEGPRTVKLFSNKENMGFGNVNDYPPSDTIVLSPDNLTGKPEVVKYVKFQNVRSLTIFIEDNQSGADTTKVQKIALYGTTVETTDMKGLKKIEDH